MNKRACDRKFTCDVGRLPTPQPAPPDPPTESALGSNGCARFVPPPPRSWSRSRCRPAGWGAAPSSRRRRASPRRPPVKRLARVTLATLAVVPAASALAPGAAPAASDEETLAHHSTGAPDATRAASPCNGEVAVARPSAVGNGT
jgi:hypothetical protein